MLKKLLCSLIGVVMLLSMSSCGGSSDTDSEKSLSEKKAQAESKEVTTTTAPVTTKTTTTTAAPKKLSEDYVLLAEVNTGTDYYELVATEKEDYNGTEIKIGVIKNNKWSVKLSSNSPFIGEDGLLSEATSKHNAFWGSIYSAPSEFRYIGHGCFYYDGKIINGNNGKSYVPEDNDGYSVNVIMTGTTFRGFGAYITNKDTIVNPDGIFILSNGNDNIIKFLDINTMKTANTGLKFYYNPNAVFYPYRDGLFCFIESSDSEKNGFYNLKGEKVIDLSKYTFAEGTEYYSEHAAELVFSRGECSFKITNDQGTDYMITINKKGEVIDSYEC